MNQYTAAKRKAVKQKGDLEATVTTVTNPLGGRAKMWTGKIRQLDPSRLLRKVRKTSKKNKGAEKNQQRGKFRPLLVYRLH